MADFTLTTKVDAPYEPTLARVREELAEVGFGVLTEIDVAATMKAKLDKDLPPKMILGACQPGFAYEALQADSRVAALMPCNVVVSDAGDGSTLIEALDPEVMPEFTGTEELRSMAAKAGEALNTALTAVAGSGA